MIEAAESVLLDVNQKARKTAFVESISALEQQKKVVVFVERRKSQMVREKTQKLETTVQSATCTSVVVLASKRIILDIVTKLSGKLQHSKRTHVFGHILFILRYCFTVFVMYQHCGPPILQDNNF